MTVCTGEPSRRSALFSALVKRTATQTHSFPPALEWSCSVGGVLDRRALPNRMLFVILKWTSTVGHVVTEARSACSQTVPPSGVIGKRRGPAAGSERRWPPSIRARHRRAEAVGRSRSALSLSARTLFKQHHRTGSSVHQEAHCCEPVVSIGGRGYKNDRRIRGRCT